MGSDKQSDLDNKLCWPVVMVWAVIIAILINLMAVGRRVTKIEDRLYKIQYPDIKRAPND